MHRPFRFAPPSPVATEVARPRLLEPLARRFDLRLITVEAGAGFGKTTLLAQAAAENRLAPRGLDAWLTCEPSDSSAPVLLDAVLRAIDARPVEGPPDVHHVCEAIWSAAPQHVCVMLDDAHHIEAGSTGEAALQQLLDDLPLNGHLVVAARRLPELSRSRLVVLRQVLALTDHELALERAESVALAARHSVAADVVQRAGGWPALAELYGRLGTAEARRFVWEEVVAPLDEAARNAFLFLVAVGGADADAVAVATGAPVDGSRLAALPLVAVDDRAGLRPHALWEELLLDRIDPVFAATARRSLAEALAARGQHGAAFELLAATASWDRALEVLFEACNDIDRPVWPDQMLRWARLVPGPLRHRPEVAYLRGTLARAGDAWSDVARDAFAEAVVGFHARGDSYREILATVRATQVAWLQGDRDTVKRTHDRGMELLAEGWPIAALLALNRAGVADIDGRTADVLAETASLDDLEPRLQYLPPLLRVFGRLAAGDADAADDDARAAATAMAAADAPTGTAAAAATGFETACIPAAVAWASGDLRRALSYPLDDPGPRQSLAERVPTIALGAIVAAHLGDVARAAALVADIDVLVPELGQRHLLRGYRAVAGAALAVARGDEDAAARELASCLDGHALAPATTGRAVRWFPSLPYLLYEPARVVLDEIPSAPARERTLDVCRALLAARGGGAWSPPAALDDPEALLTMLPAALAAELVARAAADHARSGIETISGLASLAPDATRRSLQAVASNAPEPVAAAARTLLATVPIPPAHSVRIEVLGPPRLLVDGQAVSDATWRRQRVRQLMCALVAHVEIRRERLGVLLWPDFDEAGVSANLRVTLAYVQSLLEPQRGRGHAPWFLQQSGGVLRLAGGDRLTVDAWEFEAHLDSAAAASESGAPSIELDHLLQALALWRGDYLDELAGEEWAEPLRERMRSRFVTAAVRAGELLVAASRSTEAIRVADAALAADRWCEAAYVLRARAHAAAGDNDAARRDLESAEFRSLELGIAPGPH
ncbi:MAG TPA: BTAD domain-containing putative transcriptional regulator [Acidimicrobiales bacterium]